MRHSDYTSTTKYLEGSVTIKCLLMNRSYKSVLPNTKSVESSRCLKQNSKHVIEKFWPRLFIRVRLLSVIVWLSRRPETLHVSSQGWLRWYTYGWWVYIIFYVKSPLSPQKVTQLNNNIINKQKKITIPAYMIPQKFKTCFTWKKMLVTGESKLRKNSHLFWCFMIILINKWIWPFSYYIKFQENSHSDFNGIFGNIHIG